MNQQKLKNLLHYDVLTGVFRWKIAPSNRVKQWSVAGAVNKNFYVNIRIDKKSYKAHRLAWLYVHGSMPLSQIDHINGVRSDNRIINLRAATAKQNNENIKMLSNNTTGFRGVSFHKSRKKYQATVNHNRQKIYLGLFDTAEIAGAVAAAKRAELFTHDRGRDTCALWAVWIKEQK